MTIKSSFLFAKRLVFPRSSIKSSARKSVLGAMFCIGISLIPLVVVISVSDGMIGGMTKRIIGLSSGDLQVFVARTSEYSESCENLNGFANLFRKVSGVTGVFPQIEGDALAAGKNYRTGARIRAVEPEIFSENKSFSELFNIVSGSLDKFSAEKNYAVIGQKLSELLNLSPGDSFRIVTARQNSGGAISPKVSLLKVAAIVSSGYQELDSLWVFIPLEAGFSVIPSKSANFSVMIATDQTFSEELESIQEECNEIAYGSGLVYNWKELNESQFENFSSTKVLLIFIMFLIVLVAAVNISSAIVMLVMERRREIAILKSIGGTNRGIALSFIIAGVACGVCGIVIGIPVGILLAVNANGLVSFIEKIVNLVAKLSFVAGGGSAETFSSIHLLNPEYYLTTIPVTVPVNEILLICAAVIVLSFIVSILPAVNAGKEKPLDIFRKS